MWCYESADFLQLTKASNCFRSFFVIGCTSWIIALEGLNSGRQSLGKKHFCAQTGESYSVSAEGFFFVPSMEISLFLRYYSVFGYYLHSLLGSVTFGLGLWFPVADVRVSFCF